MFLTIFFGLCASAYNLPEFNKTEREQATVVTVGGTEYTIWASAYMEVRNNNADNPGHWYPNYNIRFSPSAEAGVVEKITFDGNFYVHGDLSASVHNKTNTWNNPKGESMHTYSHFPGLDLSGALDYEGVYKVKFAGLDQEVEVRYSTVGKDDEFRSEYLTKSWLDVSADVSGVDNDRATISFAASVKVPATHVFGGVRVYEGYATSGTPVYSSADASGSVDLTGLERGKDIAYTIVAYGSPVDNPEKEVNGYATVKWAQPAPMAYGINFNGNLNQDNVPRPFAVTDAASKPGCTTYAVSLANSINDAWYANACTLTFKSETLTSANAESAPVVLNSATARQGYIPVAAENLRATDGGVVADIKVGLGMRFSEIYLHVDDATGQMWLSLPRGQREAVDFYPEVALDGRMDADHSYGWAFRTGSLLAYNENRITTYNQIFDAPLTYPESGMIVRCANLRFPTAYTVALDGAARTILFTEADNTGKGYYERVFPISSIDDLKAIFNREGNGAGAKFCCDIAAPGIAFDAVGYDMTLDPATSMPAEVRVRIYNGQPDIASMLDPARKDKTSFSLNYWHSDIFSTLGGGDHYFTYDHTDADDDTGVVYDYYVIPVHDDMTGVEPEQFVVQCGFTNHA